MKPLIREFGNITHVMNVYEPEDMPKYWNEKDRYNNDARLMDRGCILVKCDKDTAMKISAYWANNIMAIPSATYWNGEMLSICTDYASTNRQSLINALNSLQIEIYNLQPRF